MGFEMGPGNWKMETGNWRGRARRTGFNFRCSRFVARIGAWAGRLAVITVVFAAAQAARAQGCAMCANNAASVRAGAIKSLQDGILILLIPVIVMAGGFAVLVYRSRNRFRGRDFESDGGRDEEFPPVSPAPADSFREADQEAYRESETPVGAGV